MKRPRRTRGTTVGILMFGIALCALVSRYLPITGHVTLIASAFSPYLLLLAPVSTVVLILTRRWLLVILSTGLTVAMVGVQLPTYIGSPTAHPDDVRLRVGTANLRDGRADPEQVVSLASRQTDVVAFQELTPGEVARLSAAGMGVAFPYRWLDARPDAQGVGLWSRFPLLAPQRIAGYTFAMVSAQVQVPGANVDPAIVVVHLPGPWPQPIEGWRREIALLPTTLREVGDRAGAGCVVVAADLNSTLDMRPFRALLTDGYRDAAEQSGTGYQPTYPGDSALPPLIAIDHILTRNCTAAALHTVRVPGSDHRGLVATVMISRSPADTVTTQPSRS